MKIALNMNENIIKYKSLDANESFIEVSGQGKMRLNIRVEFECKLK